MFAITWPFHGAVLNHRHGRQTDVLEIEVEGRAPFGVPVTVNGIAARRDGERFCAKVCLDRECYDITAVSAGIGGDYYHTVRGLWDRHSQPRYRFAIDDNSYFLRDIATQRYRSLFDCFYLGILRGIHRDFGTKFVLNCFHATDDGFEMPAFPATYRSEWEDNASWLKLAFHARAEFPDRPYQYASAATLLQDMDLVHGEIVRFAGEATLSPPTLIHWGMAQPAVFPHLVDRGVRALSGYFTESYDVNYMLDDVRTEYLNCHFRLLDVGSGIVFSKIAMVCNTVPIDRIVPTLQPLLTHPDGGEVMDLMTHEQYFWPFYKRHIADHEARLRLAIGFVSENGYRPVFLHEGLLGGK